MYDVFSNLEVRRVVENNEAEPNEEDRPEHHHALRHDGGLGAQRQPAVAANNWKKVNNMQEKWLSNI